MNKNTDYHIKWLVRRDYPEVLFIDHQCNGEAAMTESELVEHLTSRNVIGMVLELPDAECAIAGYMIYELCPNRINLLHIAVSPEMQRQGVGTALITKLKTKLSSHKRRSITILVRDSALAFHYFLKAVGFQAIRVCQNSFADTHEDGYLFSYAPESLVGEEVMERASLQE